MVKKNKGLLKKIGCILISASILLTGWTFFGSSISIADGDTTIVDEVLNEDPDTTEEDVEEVAETEETEESEDAADSSEETTEEATDETTTTFSTDSLELYSLPATALGASLASTNADGKYTDDDGAIYNNSSKTELISVPDGVTSFTVPSSVTVVDDNALSNSDVTTLIFANGNNLTSFGSQSSWYATGTKIDLTGSDEDSYAVIYFRTMMETLLADGVLIEVVFDSSEETDVTTKYSVTVYKQAYKSDGVTKDGDPIKDTSLSASYVAGTTITASGWDGYVAFGTTTYKVTSDETQEVTFNYKPATSVTVNVYKQVYESDKTTVSGDPVEDTVLSGTYYEGTTITASEWDGYTAFGTTTYTVSSDATQNVTFTYTASGDDPSPSPDTTTYTVTIKGNFYENDGTTYIGERTITSYTQAAGKVISAPTVDGYTAFGTTTYTVTASNSQTATFTYKKTTASSSSTKKFKVTVYDVFYDQTMTKKIETKTRQTDTYSQGDTFSYDPKTYSGYEYVSAENQSGTVNADRTVTFKYKATTASGKTTSNSKYSVTAGANQKVPSNVGTVTITCDGPLDKIVAIKVDGVALAQNQFTVESGSTILTLTASYVSSLSAGDHVVRFDYTDGWAETLLTITGKTTTTVTYKVSSDGSISSGHTKDTTPTTADGFDSRYLLCLAIFLLGAGTILFSNQKKLEAILAGDRDDE